MPRKALSIRLDPHVHMLIETRADDAGLDHAVACRQILTLCANYLYRGGKWTDMIDRVAKALALPPA